MYVYNITRACTSILGASVPGCMGDLVSGNIAGGSYQAGSLQKPIYPCITLH